MAPAVGDAGYFLTSRIYLGNPWAGDYAGGFGEEDTEAGSSDGIEEDPVTGKGRGCGMRGRAVLSVAARRTGGFTLWETWTVDSSCEGDTRWQKIRLMAWKWKPALEMYLQTSA
jgi:hypothetical protein